MMEKSDKIALWAAGGFLFYWYILRGFASAKVWLQSYEVTKLNIITGTVDLNVSVGVTNPLLISIPLHRISGSITLNNTNVATVDTTYNLPIKARRSNIIPIPVIGNLAALSLTPDIIKNSGLQGMELGIDIKIELGGDEHSIAIPIKAKKTIE